MQFRVILVSAGLATLTLISAAVAMQKPFREYPGWEYTAFPLPTDYMEKTEWVFARLMYPTMYGRRRFMGDWRYGVSAWTTDYPRSDRHIVQAVRRLSRVHARSVEQPVNLDDEDDVFNWPFLYGVEVGQWDLTETQAAKMRDYLLRGGFFMCDDFHGTREWEIFMASMRRVFPDRLVVDIPDKDPIFHILYDLDKRFQVPGAQFLESGQMWEYDGFDAKWRGIYDDKGRLMVVICHNMDLGDSWEWADEPAYPEKFSGLGIRIALNYIVYSMSH